VVAGFATTVDKAQGLTVKDGMAIHPNGSKRYRPALKHGLPFVAFTRSESFHLMAFCSWPPWEDFCAGLQIGFATHASLVLWNATNSSDCCGL